MVSRESVEKQFKRLGFNHLAWGRSEARELPNILMPDEEIYECVNGIYEGGFALLIATDIRLLLIDKKPLNYLTVEDLRFDMITELDYNHRLLGAYINISAGSKNLKFRSYNQPRLRKLIDHVQHCIAQSKKKQSEHASGQNQHLEAINQQLQAYLLAQHKSQEELKQRLDQYDKSGKTPDPGELQMTAPKPDPQLADYLFAQSLLREYQPPETGQSNLAKQFEPESVQQPAVPQETQDLRIHAERQAPSDPQIDDMVAAGQKEIFGHALNTTLPTPPAPQPVESQPTIASISQSRIDPLEINPLRIAYSKLPMAMRNRKFGRPSFHAHSNAAQNSVTPEARA